MPLLTGLTCLISSIKKCHSQESGSTWTNTLTSATVLVKASAHNLEDLTTRETCPTSQEKTALKPIPSHWMPLTTMVSKKPTYTHSPLCSKPTQPTSSSQWKTNDHSLLHEAQLSDHTSTVSTGLETTEPNGLTWKDQSPTTSTFNCTAFRWSDLTFVDSVAILLKNSVQDGSNSQPCTHSPETTTTTTQSAKSPTLWAVQFSPPPKLASSSDTQSWSITTLCSWQKRDWAQFSNPCSSLILATITHTLMTFATLSSWSVLICWLHQFLSKTALHEESTCPKVNGTISTTDSNSSQVLTWLITYHLLKKFHCSWEKALLFWSRTLNSSDRQKT